jgi:HTH-type transcriptional regulator, glycine betaine synthesis regulator
MDSQPSLTLLALITLVSGARLLYNFHIFLKGIKIMKAGTTDLRERLEAVEDQFVDLWNNMANLWGISPTMARIHGLLFICGSALSMDDIMARLAISRGNVSMNLSKLMEWGLVRRIHKKGNRKEFYQSLSDIWELFTLVANQRKRREIDPILNTLRRCRDELSPEKLGPGADLEPSQVRYQRVNELFKLLTLLDSLALRFFESHKGLREAVELLAQEE